MSYQEDIALRLLEAEKQAAALLQPVRAKLQEIFLGIDSSGADALMLRALLIRAGRNRYNLDALNWLVQSAYADGFKPYEFKLCDFGIWDDERGYDPFKHYHSSIPTVDEDYMDPLPAKMRPLKFLAQDLQQWELELNTCHQNTRDLLNGKEIDE